jgi:hypothetical protein
MNLGQKDFGRFNGFNGGGGAKSNVGSDLRHVRGIRTTMKLELGTHLGL